MFEIETGGDSRRCNSDAKWGNLEFEMILKDYLTLL